MNCELCERRLLASADPEDPPAEIALHLADCPGCRDRQRRLVEIEAQVPLLPVPPSQAKARFLQRLLNDPLPVRDPVTVPLRRRAGHRVVLVLGGMAAAAAILVGVILSGVLSPSSEKDRDQPLAKKPDQDSRTQRPGPATSPQFLTATLVEQLVKCDARLAQAETPRQRLDALADMAEAVRDEAKVRVSTPQVLETLARLYEKTVVQGIVARARAVPSRERPGLLEPAAARLAKTEQAIDDLARKAPPAAAGHLQRVASLARAGSNELRALLQEAAP